MGERVAEPRAQPGHERLVIQEDVRRLNRQIAELAQEVGSMHALVEARRHALGDLRARRAAKDERHPPPPPPAQAPQPGEARPPSEAPPSHPAPRQPSPERADEKEAPRTAAAFGLFDGTSEVLSHWRTVGAELLVDPDRELCLWTAAAYGLAYYTGNRFNDFLLRLRYRLRTPAADARVAVCLQEPKPTDAGPRSAGRRILGSGGDSALVAISTALQVRLGAASADSPLGTFVRVPFGGRPGFQQHPGNARLRDGDWNDLEIEARGKSFAVRLNGVETARLWAKEGFRGRPASAGPAMGLVGLVVRALVEPASRDRLPVRRSEPERRPRASRASLTPRGLSGPWVPRRPPATRASASSPGKEPERAAPSSEKQERGPGSLFVHWAEVEALSEARPVGEEQVPGTLP